MLAGQTLHMDVATFLGRKNICIITKGFTGRLSGGEDLGEQMQIMIAFYLVCLATIFLVPDLIVPRRTFPRSRKTDFMWSVFLVF